MLYAAATLKAEKKFILDDDRKHNEMNPIYLDIAYNLQVIGLVKKGLGSKGKSSVAYCLSGFIDVDTITKVDFHPPDSCMVQLSVSRIFASHLSSSFAKTATIPSIDPTIVKSLRHSRLK